MNEKSAQMKPGTKVRLKSQPEITATIDDEPRPERRYVWLKDIRVNGEPFFDANESLPVLDIARWEENPIVANQG